MNIKILWSRDRDVNDQEMFYRLAVALGKKCYPQLQQHFEEHHTVPRWLLHLSSDGTLHAYRASDYNDFTFQEALSVFLPEVPTS